MALTPFAALLAQMPKWRAYLLALLAGGCLPFSLAPFNLWPIAIIGIALLALLIADQRPTQTFIRSFFFGLGLYGIGVSWIDRKSTRLNSSHVPISSAVRCWKNKNM